MLDTQRAPSSQEQGDSLQLKGGQRKIEEIPVKIDFDPQASFCPILLF